MSGQDKSVSKDDTTMVVGITVICVIVTIVAILIV
jgi:hypothetical protein